MKFTVYHIKKMYSREKVKEKKKEKNNITNLEISKQNYIQFTITLLADHPVIMLK